MLPNGDSLILFLEHGVFCSAQLEAATAAWPSVGSPEHRVKSFNLYMI